jgi:pimeloyl-ACP methyl ester carboxylesterase
MESAEAPPAEPAASGQGPGGYAIKALRLGGGRTLAYACMGAPLAGARLVCLYHHGVPASLVEAEPLAAAGAALGVAVVAFDRPGMGGSTRDPLMSLASVAADAAALLDHLALPSAVQVGESGGAPYAAAFAALQPRRTQQLVTLAGLGAIHGEHAALRACLAGMDRWCLMPRGLGAGLLINSCVRAAAALAPGAVKRGAGGSLGPADAAFLRDSPDAEQHKDWLLRFLQARRPAAAAAVLHARAGSFPGGGGAAAVLGCSAVRGWPQPLSPPQPPPPLLLSTARVPGRGEGRAAGLPGAGGALGGGPGHGAGQVGSRRPAAALPPASTTLDAPRLLVGIGGFGRVVGMLDCAALAVNTSPSVLGRSSVRRAVVWHGSEDAVVPPSHAQFYQSALPRCQLHLVQGEGHISLVGRHGGEILQDVAGWAEAHGQLRQAAPPLLPEAAHSALPAAD